MLEEKPRREESKRLNPDYQICFQCGTSTVGGRGHRYTAKTFLQKPMFVFNDHFNHQHTRSILS